MRSAVTAVGALAALAAPGCDTTDLCDTPPRILPNISPLILCQQEAEFVVPVLLENRGCKDLEIQGAEIRYDTRGAFSSAEVATGADRIPPDGEAFIRFTYSPPATGEDHVWLVVRSNDDRYPELIIPVCGPGAVAGENAEACTESTQCEAGLGCMRLNTNSVLVGCDAAGEDGAAQGDDAASEGCTCQRPACMSNCRCPAEAVAAGLCDPAHDPP